MFGRLIAIWKWLTPWLERTEPALRWTERAHLFYGLGGWVLGGVGGVMTGILSILANLPAYLWIPLAFTVFCLPPVAVAAGLHLWDRWHPTPAPVPSSSPHETKPALEQPSTPAQPPVALEPQKKAEAAVAPARIVPQSLLATYPTLVGLDLNVLYLVDHEAGTVLLKFLPTEQIEDKP